MISFILISCDLNEKSKKVKHEADLDSLKIEASKEVISCSNFKIFPQFYFCDNDIFNQVKTYELEEFYAGFKTKVVKDTFELLERVDHIRYFTLRDTLKEDYVYKIHLSNANKEEVFSAKIDSVVIDLDTLGGIYEVCDLKYCRINNIEQNRVEFCN